METRQRLSIHELSSIVREHAPAHRVYEHRQIEQMRESLAEYGIALSNTQSRFALMMTRLLRVVDVHDAARARKDYATSDALRAALDVSCPFDTTPKQRQEAYDRRFEVILGDKLNHFLATPPRS